MRKQFRYFLKPTTVKIIATLAVMIFVFFLTGAVLSEAIWLVIENNVFSNIIIQIFLWPAFVLVKLANFLGTWRLAENLTLNIDITLWFISELLYIYFIICLVVFLFKRKRNK